MKADWPSRRTLGVGSAGLATRPNLIAPVTHPGDGKTNLPGHTESYLSAASFQAPAFGEFGDAQPGSVRGPKEVDFNVALDKGFPIGERVNFKMRIEAFNVFIQTPSFRARGLVRQAALER